MAVEILRMLERLIVALGGVASIYWGYRLFLIIPLQNNAGGSFKSQLLSITLTKIGPGVFFALFGAYILAADLNSQIHRSEEEVPIFVATGSNELPNLLGKLVAAIKSLPDSPGKCEVLQLASEVTVASQTKRIEKFSSKRVSDELIEKLSK